MPQSGHNSYVIVGEQDTDWDTLCPLASMTEIIYEFVSSGLRNASDPIIPERFKGNASPTEQIANFLTAGGDLQMHLHADNMVLWWTHLLGDDAIASVDFTAQEVFGDGIGGDKAIPASPFGLDTQPTATDPVSSPGKLIMTLDASDSGVVTITGTDQNDAAISEVVTITATDTATTTKYFKTVNATGIAYTGLAVATAILIEADKNVWTHTIEVKDALLNGLTIEAVKGARPSVYGGCLINSGTIDIGDVLTFTLNLIAKRGWNGYKVPASALEEPTASDTATDVSGYSRVSPQVLPAWGMALYLEGSATATPIANATFAFNNNLGYPRRFIGVRTEPKPTRQSNREITLTTGIDYESGQYDFDAQFLGGAPVEDCSLVCMRTPYAGAEYKLTITLPNCEISTFPDPAISDYAEIIQDLVLRPVRTAGAVGPDEMTVAIQCVAAN